MTKFAIEGNSLQGLLANAENAKIAAEKARANAQAKLWALVAMQKIIHILDGLVTATSVGMYMDTEKTFEIVCDDVAWASQPGIVARVAALAGTGANHTFAIHGYGTAGRSQVGAYSLDKTSFGYTYYSYVAFPAKVWVGAPTITVGFTHNTGSYVSAQVRQEKPEVAILQLQLAMRAAAAKAA